MTNVKKNSQSQIIKLFYELTLLQRGVEKNDFASIDAIFRIIHNVSSMAIEELELVEIQSRYNQMCDLNFLDLAIAVDLRNLGKVIA